MLLVTVSASSPSTKLSPIPDFAPSLAASSALGTTAAVACRFDDCPAVILLMRSTSTSVSVDDERTWVHVDGIRVSHQDRPMVRGSRRWTRVGSHAVVCLTGFGPDVDFLISALLQSVESHRIVYENTHRYTASSTALDLAGRLQEATKWNGGRPFGVQGLVVGDQQQSRELLSLLTIDPSGGYRSWGTASAIGKAAEQVRKALHAAVKDRHSPPSASEALEIVLQACTTVMHEVVGRSAEDDRYEAVIVWTSKGPQMCVATIDPTYVRELQQKITKGESPGATRP